MTADVVVVGGGSIGLASAWRLAQRGIEVEVVDPHPGGGASGVAAGMLAPVTEARLGQEALLRLGMASWARWPDFVAELEDTTAVGWRIGYRADGTVVVAVDADDRAQMHDLVDRQRSLGLEVEHLSVGDIRALEPALTPAARRGALAAGERSVDPVRLVEVLAVAAERAGVTVRRDRVARVLLAGERAVGVELASGDCISAGTVVLAAGAWSPGVAGLPEVVRVPVRPVKGEVVTLRQRPDALLLRHTVRGFVRGSDVYLVPRDDGRVVCGATVQEKGWDTTPTAGAAYALLRDALALFPGLDEAEFVGVRAGFRPGTPDDLPLIGPTALDGLVLATGHYRNGILLSPVTADAVGAAVTGDPLSDEVLPCDPRRFTAESPSELATARSPGMVPR